MLRAPHTIENSYSKYYIISVILIDMPLVARTLLIETCCKNDQFVVSLAATIALSSGEMSE